MDFQGMFSVAGKVVCVTGGGGGIGRGIAGVFVAGGARVYIASRSDLSATAEKLAQEGPGECIPLQADLAKDEDIAGLAKTFEEHDGKLDVLVNNAALGNYMGRFGEFDMDMWDTVTRVNQRAPFALTQACLPLLTEAGSQGPHAAVVNIASVDGIRIPADNDCGLPHGQGLPDPLHETVRRGGSATRAAGRAGGTSPSTPSPRGRSPACSTPTSRPRRGHAAISAMTVVGRPGKPEEIGAACAFFASAAGAYVTGSVLPVDGGLLVGRSANT